MSQFIITPAILTPKGKTEFDAQHINFSINLSISREAVEADILSGLSGLPLVGDLSADPEKREALWKAVKAQFKMNTTSALAFLGHRLPAFDGLAFKHKVKADYEAIADRYIGSLPDPEKDALQETFDEAKEAYEGEQYRLKAEADAKRVAELEAQVAALKAAQPKPKASGGGGGKPKPRPEGMGDAEWARLEHKREMARKHSKASYDKKKAETGSGKAKSKASSKASSVAEAEGSDDEEE
jgi:hypothetical protein